MFRKLLFAILFVICLPLAAHASQHGKPVVYPPRFITVPWIPSVSGPVMYVWPYPSHYHAQHGNQHHSKSSSHRR